MTASGVTLAAHVIISRSYGNDDKPMHLMVTDDISGCCVVELYMRLDEFAKALTSSHGSAEMHWYSKSPIGMKAEHKTENVPFEGSAHGNPTAVAAALEPFEINGWKARSSDMGNGHRRTLTGYSVTFFRHVDAVTGEPHEN